jgi:hypothetical protein
LIREEAEEKRKRKDKVEKEQLKPTRTPIKNEADLKMSQKC